MLVFVLVVGWSGAGGNTGNDFPTEHSEKMRLESQERIGVLQSRDHGGTWTFLGHASFNAPALIPVDPSPFALPEGIALYFLDLATLGKPPGTPRIIYRAVTTDGLIFSEPIPAFSYPNDMTDPYILQNPSGSYRMYIQAAGSGVISAVSSDGLVFTLETGVRSTDGATPGALVTPELEIRLFLAGGSGISSALSNDGLTFAPEPGLRIVKDSYKLVADPHPIHLQGGGYLMTYISVPPTGAPPLDNEIRIANSVTGFNWSIDPDSLILGANPGLVENAEGTLTIYFVNFHAFDKGVYLPMVLYNP